VRILVTGQPASGLFMLTSLLRELYALGDLNAQIGELPPDADALAAFIDSGGFRDHSLLAWHYPASEALVESSRKKGIKVICVARDPYITFDTIYSNANTARGMPTIPESKQLKGAAFESREVANFISRVFAGQLQLTAGWQRAGCALMVNQEDLMLAPEKLMQLLSPVLGSVEEDRLALALDRMLQVHALGSAGNALSDSRLPRVVIDWLNQVIPEEFSLLGYEKAPDTHAGVMNARMRKFARFQEAYAERQRIFLVGHGKSGTTWLHMLFFHHPNTAVVAERRLFEHPDENTALLDSLLNDEDFESWFRSSSFGKKAPEHAQVRYELSRLMSDYLLYRALAMRKSAKGFERRTPITHFSEKIALNTEQDARVTIDTLKKLYPDAKIVHIVRDPRDVAVSAMFHSYRNFREKRERNWITDFVDSVLDGKNGNMLKKQAVSAYFKSHAKAWNRIASIFHERGELLYGDNYLLVRYEDLLQAPQAQVKRLFDFTGLAHDEQLLMEVVDKASFKNLSKGRKAGEQDSSSFYRKGVAGDWKNYLTPEASRKVFKDARELMEQFGYE